MDEAALLSRRSPGWPRGSSLHGVLVHRHQGMTSVGGHGDLQDVLDGPELLAVTISISSTDPSSHEEFAAMSSSLTVAAGWKFFPVTPTPPGSGQPKEMAWSVGTG